MKFNILKYKKVNVYIDGSLIKSTKKHNMIAIDGSKILLNLNSEYIKKFDNIDIKIKLNPINYGEFMIDGNTFCIGLFHKKNFYRIDFQFNNKNEINELKNHLINYLSECNLNECKYLFKDFDVMLDHHYGTLKLITDDIVSKLKNGKIYYILLGQIIDQDFKGYSLYALKFKDSIEKSSLYTIKKGNLKIEENYLYDCDGYYGTGSGCDPVYVISRINKDFKLFKDVPKLDTLNKKYSKTLFY
jgi:hypothetical protein